MSDEGVLNKIEQLVAEEHALLGRETESPHPDKQSPHPDKHERLAAIEVELDRCWDLLRQRRAHREFDQNPDEASVRDADTVERYLQ
jgi:hypothetical protein